MGRSKEMKNGRPISYYLDTRHTDGLKAFQEKHQHKSAGAALRALLDVVCEIEGIEPEAESQS